MEGRSVVALPFKVAAAFLFLIFLWGFVGEEMSISNPVSYEYEHTKKEQNNEIHGDSTHGSFMPWRQHVRDRHIHLDTSHIRVGEKVQLMNLTSRPDLNGITGRVMEYNGKVYTVRLVHGIGRFKLKPGNIKPIASKTNDVLKSAIISHMNHSSADTLDKIEQMIKPQHSHLENANSREHRHHSNSSSSYTRFFILFVLVVIFCSYGYSEFEADEAVNVSIKCAPPSEYVFVDADEENPIGLSSSGMLDTQGGGERQDNDRNDTTINRVASSEKFELVAPLPVTTSEN